MKPVIQQEITGCGIASVATLTGLSYQHVSAAAGRLGIFTDNCALWSDTRPLRMLLEHFGIIADVAEHPFTSWDALPDRALLAVKWHLEQGQPHWHWVVFWRSPDGPVVFDSKKALKTHARTDFWRIRPKWYIPVGLKSGSVCRRGRTTEPS